MKFRNTRKAIIVLADRESVPPYGISRDYTEEEIKNNLSLKMAIDKKVFVPDDGKTPIPAPDKDRRVAYDREDGIAPTKVNKKVGAGKPVEYVVADMEGCDGITTDPDSITSLPGKRTADHIEEGLSARDYNKTNRTPSEALDAEYDKENLDSEFDDEENLAENEGEVTNIGDADADIAADAAEMVAGRGKVKPVKYVVEEETSASINEVVAESNLEHVGDDDIAGETAQVLTARGKGGSELRPVTAVVDEKTTQALNEVAQSLKKDTDDNEQVASAPGKVCDFLRQSFSAKKWAIAKETDADFLKEVKSYTSSDNVRSIISQRLAELDSK